MTEKSSIFSNQQESKQNSSETELLKKYMSLSFRDKSKNFNDKANNIIKGLESSTCKASFQKSSIQIGFPLSELPYSSSDYSQIKILGDMFTTVYKKSVGNPTVVVNPFNQKIFVTAWEQSVISNSGAFDIAVSISIDGGSSWNCGVVPFQIQINGFSQRAAFPILKYSSDAKILYLSVYGICSSPVKTKDNRSFVAVLTSTNNGTDWNALYRIFNTEDNLSDKMNVNPVIKNLTIESDSNKPEIAYSAFNIFVTPSFTHSIAQFSRTSDCGTIWFPPCLLYDATSDLKNQQLSNGQSFSNQLYGGKLISLPEVGLNINSDNRSKSGDLLFFTARIFATPQTNNKQFKNDQFPYQCTNMDIVIIRSRNRGLFWETQSKQITVVGSKNLRIFTGGYTYGNNNQISGGIGKSIESISCNFSVAINKVTGSIYIAYVSSDFRHDSLPQIGLVSSYDGGLNWSNPIMVNKTPQNCPNPQAFCPNIAINSLGFVAIFYTDFRSDVLTDPENITLAQNWCVLYKDQPELRLFTFKKEVCLSENVFVIQSNPLTTNDYRVVNDTNVISFIGTTRYHSIIPTNSGIATCFIDSIGVNPESFNHSTLVYNDVKTDTQVNLDENTRNSIHFNIITLN